MIITVKLWDYFWFLTCYSWEILRLLLPFYILSWLKYILILTYCIVFSLILLIHINKNWLCWILNRNLFMKRICLNRYLRLLSWHTNRMIQNIRSELNRNFLLLITNLHWNLILRNIVHLHRYLMILHLHHTHTFIMHLIFLEHHHTYTLVVNLKLWFIILNTYLFFSSLEKVKITQTIII